MRDKFSYMGRDVKISMNKAQDTATIKVDNKDFKIHLHTEGKPEDNYIRLWMCPEAYTMTETPEAMAKHIFRYWYQFA